MGTEGRLELEPQGQQVLRLAQPRGVPRTGGKEQPDEDLLHDGPDRFEGERRLAPQAFLLEERVRDRAEHDMMVPARKRAALEMIEASSVFSC